jgi:hypothetical protein
MTDMPAPPPIIKGLSEVAADYDAAICDVWGVLHNGKQPYLKAADAMRRFRAERGPWSCFPMRRGWPMALSGCSTVSVCPRTSTTALSPRLGRARRPVRRTEGKPALPLYYLGPPRDNPLFEGLNLKLVASEEAEVVLCTASSTMRPKRPTIIAVCWRISSRESCRFSAPIPTSSCSAGQAHLLRRCDRAAL